MAVPIELTTHQPYDEVIVAVHGFFAAAAAYVDIVRVEQPLGNESELC